RFRFNVFFVCSICRSATPTSNLLLGIINAAAVYAANLFDYVCISDMANAVPLVSASDQGLAGANRSRAATCTATFSLRAWREICGVGAVLRGNQDENSHSLARNAPGY